MAKKKEEAFNYTAELRILRERGPERLYLLWGPEDYLREQFLSQLKKTCLPEGEDDFSYKRIDGPALDANAFQQAADAMPFMTEHTFVELRDVDINKLADADACLKTISDIPDYCTVVFVQNAQYEPDGRLRFVKTLRSEGKELKFTQQSQGMLTDWIVRRFAAAGKGIPEIDKIAAYASGDKVTQADVEAVANHIPEAVVFEMTELIAQKKINSALSVLSELLADRNNEPIMMLAVLGKQMRQLYAARLALEKNLGTKYVMEVCSMKYDYIASKLLTAAKGFTLDQLRRAVELCAETDYRMKSSGADPKELLKEAVVRIAAGESHAQD